MRNLKIRASVSKLLDLPGLIDQQKYIYTFFYQFDVTYILLEQLSR